MPVVFGENISRWRGGCDGGIINGRFGRTQSLSSLYFTELRIASEWALTILHRPSSPMECLLSPFSVLMEEKEENIARHG